MRIIRSKNILQACFRQKHYLFAIELVYAL